MSKIVYDSVPTCEMCQTYQLSTKAHLELSDQFKTIQNQARQ